MNVQPITISIIIVTWNGRQFALECLESMRHLQQHRDAEIIVVDNSSCDGTPDFIEQDFPWVRLVRNSANRGFSKASNIGKGASKGKYLCLVNSDVKVQSDCLPTMQALMDADLSLGMLGHRMLCPDGTESRPYMRFTTVWRGLSSALRLRRVP